MDLSFARIPRGTAVTALPTELAVLLASAAGRQGASRTARVQVRLGIRRGAATLLAPAEGNFNPVVAALLRARFVASGERRNRLETDVKQTFT